MSRFDYDEYEKLESSGKLGKGNGGSKTTYLRYFSLENDLDSAIVRFPYTSTKEFDIVMYHRVKSGDRKLKVTCLRTPTDDICKCPLCEAEEKLITKFFVKVIEYEKDDEGNIVATPKIWETRTAFRKKLKTLIDEYGDLTEFLFKVIRHGAKGDNKTDYDIIPASPKIYKDELYPYDESLFKDYNVVGRGGAVRAKTAEDMKVFLENGEFPAPKSTKTESDSNLKDMGNGVKGANLEQLEGEDFEDTDEAPKVEDRPFEEVEEEAVEEPAPRVTRPGRVVPQEDEEETPRTFTRPKRYQL